MSRGLVNKSTGDRIPSAPGYIVDKVGDLSALHTTAKDKAVSAINEVADAVSAIDDGASIDSFADVETALAGKADLTDLAPAFSTATAYTVGQYVSYEGNIYKCTSAHSAGAWVAGDFTLVAVGSELESKQDKTDNNLNTTDKTTTGAINELKSGLTNLVKSNTITLTTATTGHASTPIRDTVKVLQVKSDGSPCLAFTFNGFWFFALLTWDASTLQLALKPSVEVTFTYYYVD